MTRSCGDPTTGPASKTTTEAGKGVTESVCARVCACDAGVRACLCVCARGDVCACLGVHVQERTCTCLCTCVSSCVWSQAGPGASHGSEAATVHQLCFSALFSPLTLSLKAAEILQQRFCASFPHKSIGRMAFPSRLVSFPPSLHLLFLSQFPSSLYFHSFGIRPSIWFEMHLPERGATGDPSLDFLSSLL